MCSFCNEYETQSFWDKYCKNCSMLRRMLIIHNSEKCLEILKRVLIRNDIQIDHKVQMELKKKVIKEVEGNDNKDYDKPTTRSKNKIDKV